MDRHERAELDKHITGAYEDEAREELDEKVRAIAARAEEHAAEYDAIDRAGIEAFRKIAEAFECLAGNFDGAQNTIFTDAFVAARDFADMLQKYADA